MSAHDTCPRYVWRSCGGGYVGGSHCPAVLLLQLALGLSVFFTVLSGSGTHCQVLLLPVHAEGKVDEGWDTSEAARAAAGEAETKGWMDR